MIRTFEYKLYPNVTQVQILDRWLSVCCHIYNRALEQRIKAYQRRGQSVDYNDQQSLLTQQRGRIESLRSVPVGFERDALRRVDRGFKAFFRRLKAGEKPGFPRFRSWRRYNSLEYLAISAYLHSNRIRVPGMGMIPCRGRVMPDGIQRALRVVRRAGGWFAQILLDDGKSPPDKRTIESAVGIDMGLTTFATMSDGSKIDNPRWLTKSTRKLRALHRRVSRRIKGSIRRRKAVLSLHRQYRLLGDQRRNLCHQHSTALVRKYDLIAVENLNVAGMIRSRFGKSILDAAWATFIVMVERKAESAGVTFIAVNARGTSQECPDCGAVKPKKLSERWHSCGCGCECQRDHAASQVILARGLVSTGSIRPVRCVASVDFTRSRSPSSPDETGRLLRTLGSLSHGQLKKD